LGKSKEGSVKIESLEQAQKPAFKTVKKDGVWFVDASSFFASSQTNY